MALLSTLASVEVTADCAPITSLFSRLTSAPVRVRVKNATGIRWTWLEDDLAQVHDQALTDARGEPARREPDDGLEHGQRGNAGGQPDHRRGRGRPLPGPPRSR